MRAWLVMVLWLVSAAWMQPAGAQALHVELLRTEGVTDGPPMAATVLARAAASPDGVARVALPHRAPDYWLRLTTDDAIPAEAGRLLVLEGAQSMGDVTYYPPAAAPRTIRDASVDGGGLMRRGWVLPLPHGWPAASVAYLRVAGTTTEPLRLRLATAADIAREQRGQARLAIAAFTAMLLMMVMMTVAWLVFRDLLYLSYAGYLLCVGIYSMLLTGDATDLWGLSHLAASGFTAPWSLATLAVILQLVFTVRFLELDRLLPRAARLLRVLQALHVVLLAALLLGREHVHGWYNLVGNALLMLSVPAVLAVAVLAWRRGASYAGYYLLGWTPLMAVAALAAGSQLGVVAASWAERELPLVAVLESAVLALALSRHAATRHRIALLAQQSPERDTVTGALNEPALLEMLESWYQLGSLGARRHRVLLLGLTDFAHVVERRGRAVGDAVLQQSLVRLRSLLGPDDIIARVHGDRFAIVTECDRADQDAQIARRLAECVAQQPFRIDGHELLLTASVGVALSQRGETVAMLLQRADAALHAARGAGSDATGFALRAQPAA